MRAVTLPNVSYPLQKGENLSKFPIADNTATMSDWVIVAFAKVQQ